MRFISPLKAVLVNPTAADSVISPPYDVVTRKEASALSQGKRWHFLHITRAEIDLDENLSPYDASVYSTAAAHYEHWQTEGLLRAEPTSRYYVYRLQTKAHVQTGIVCLVDIKAYEDGRLVRHELTRPVKENDRIRHIEALNAQVSPVLLTYKHNQALAHLLESATCSKPYVVQTDAMGCEHSLWCIEPKDLPDWQQALDSLQNIYVADGHHRTAAAAAVAKKHPENHAKQFCLSVIFPDNELEILPYNRVVRDLNGLNEYEFLARLQTIGKLECCAEGFVPDSDDNMAVYLKGQWYRGDLPLKQSASAAENLSTQRLSEQVLEPILGISDIRNDERVSFVGGRDVLAKMQTLVDSGEYAVAFSLLPTSMAELMEIGDAKDLMPPKSTWFEPKLADGLVSYSFSDASVCS